MQRFLDKIDLECERPFELLSFVGRGRNYWAPERSGEYARDCAVGRTYARELIDYITFSETPGFLGHVCGAVMAGGIHDGVEIGFFHEISVQLIAARRTIDR